VDIKKRFIKNTSHKKDAKFSKDTVQAFEDDRKRRAERPKWVQDEPPGYVKRGEDHENKDLKNTATLLFKLPPDGIHSGRGMEDNPLPPEDMVDSFMTRARKLAESLGVGELGPDAEGGRQLRVCTDFLDKALCIYRETGYDAEIALKQLGKLDKGEVIDTTRPTKAGQRRRYVRPERAFNTEQKKKFAEGVAKYGSELRNVRLYMGGNVEHADVVRYYYWWKKTPQGKEIWGSYGGRKGTKRKQEVDASSKLADDVADDQDDSAFDNQKAVQCRRGFQCKFCSTRKSRQWRRAPGVAPGATVPPDGRTNKEKAMPMVVALCQRCAYLWRRYAIEWEDYEEIAKKVAQGGGRAWRRRIDDEVLEEFKRLNEGSVSAKEVNETSDASSQLAGEQPAKKKLKMNVPQDGVAAPAIAPEAKKKQQPPPAPQPPPPPPRLPTPPPVAAEPKLLEHFCAICFVYDGNMNVCKDCRLHVHPSCYGIGEQRNARWSCDTCMNDRKETASYVSAYSYSPVRIILTICRNTSASYVHERRRHMSI